MIRTTRTRLSAITAAVAVPTLLLGVHDASAQSPPDEGLTALGVYDSGVGEGGSEIVAVDPATDQMFITNGESNAVDIVSIFDPMAPTAVSSVDVSPYGDGIQSVAVGEGVFAVAVKAADPVANGSVVVFTTAGDFVGAHEVGNLPDAIAFTPDGRYIVVANEAEPVCAGDELLADPEGSISIIDTTVTGSGSGSDDAGTAVATADFNAFDQTRDALLSDGVRIFFPGSTVSQDLEPEYVTISPDGTTAYVSLQENNAVAVVDIASATVTDLVPLGYKDHNVVGNGLDPSNRDGAEAIENWKVLGMYMPDTIAAVELAGVEYLVTANEGDARDYDCYSEEIRVGDIALASPPYDASDVDDDRLGRLKTTDAFPSEFVDGELQQVYSYGARSFTIWTTSGEVVFDSGDRIAQQLTGTDFFNLDENETDGRSDDKGAEPEALAVGEIDGRTFAFVGLERSGGVMMYDITDPAAAVFIDDINTAGLAPESGDGVAALVDGTGDIGPEGIAFISGAESPTGEPLLAVSFEISGTTRLMQINTDEPATPVTVLPDTVLPDTVLATGPQPVLDDDLLPATGSDAARGATAAGIAALLLGLVAVKVSRRPVGRPGA